MLKQKNCSVKELLGRGTERTRHNQHNTAIKKQDMLVKRPNKYIYFSEQCGTVYNSKALYTSVL